MSKYTGKTETLIWRYPGIAPHRRRSQGQFETISAPLAVPGGTGFDSSNFALVGIEDLTDLTKPRFQRMLDNFAASPGAFKYVRGFNLLTDTWPSGKDIDLEPALKPLTELRKRNLIPFIVLGWLPEEVRGNAAPLTYSAADLEKWSMLIRQFVDQLISIWGADDVRHWYFEVWNEPNISLFGGDKWAFDSYNDFYRATAQAVESSQVPSAIQLGGPTVVYAAPTEGLVWISNFLTFVDEGDLKCDFVSFHRKGDFRPTGVPNLARVVGSLLEVADQAISTNPEKFSNIAIINDECDMLVGFELPYEPRMTAQFASWLMAITIAYDWLQSTPDFSGLSEVIAFEGFNTNLAEEATYSFPEFGLRFMAGSDNANLQLVEDCFDGRRSLLTNARTDSDFLKIPAYSFYELLRLMGDQHLSNFSPEHLYPNTNLFMLGTFSSNAISIALTVHPALAGSDVGTMNSDLIVEDVPWPTVNWAVFVISDEAPNSFAAAGGVMDTCGNTKAVRDAQELVAGSISVDSKGPAKAGYNVSVLDGKLNASVSVGPYDVLLLWITRHKIGFPGSSEWLEATVEDEGVVLRWTPSSDPSFLTYWVVACETEWDDQAMEYPPWYVVSDNSKQWLRSAMMVDTDPPPGPRRYRVDVASADFTASFSAYTDIIDV